MLDEDQVSLPDAIEALPDNAEERDMALVGLSLYDCVLDLVQRPELIPRVRKIICDEAHLARLTTEPQRQVLAQLEGKLYFPQREGRVHQLPQGNLHYRAHGLPSKWWITNLAYRKVLTNKLRAILRALGA